MDSHSADERWMRLALSLGSRGLGTTWPNPAVGCVIVRDGRVLGRGLTQPSGRPHAERMALAQAGEAANGATAYVTLEPCAHTGKTSPCSDALIEAGITRVVSALEDPDPRVAGRGLKKLREAGLDVVTGVLESEAVEANIGFLSRITINRPLVTLKLASTIDGKIATKTGESQWITGSDARAYVHYLRATHDAVMVGSGTSLSDNPKLNVRLEGMENRKPVSIVMDSKLATPVDSALGQNADQHPVWLCHGPDADKDIMKAWKTTGADLISCPLDGKHLSLKDALNGLASKGITRVLCEGGGQLAASLLRQGYVDRLISFTAGMAIGADGKPNLANLGVENLSDGPRLKLISHKRIGQDLVSEWAADKDYRHK